MRGRRQGNVDGGNIIESGMGELLNMRNRNIKHNSESRMFCNDLGRVTV